jgi:hypothetical protein
LHAHTVLPEAFRMGNQQRHEDFNLTATSCPYSVQTICLFSALDCLLRPSNVIILF